MKTCKVNSSIYRIGKDKWENYYRWKSALTGSAQNANYINALTT